MEELVINNIGNRIENRTFDHSLAADLDEFRGDLAELKLTEEQETELLSTLWQIMGFFARAGFEVDVCGLIFSAFNEASAPAPENGTLLPSINMESATKPDGGSA